jgi:hypothetical protein
MRIAQDHTADGERHGWTKDDGRIWYWVVDDDGLRWREDGYPRDQDPDPPDEVREATETWVDHHLD